MTINIYTSAGTQTPATTEQLVAIRTDLGAAAAADVTAAAQAAAAAQTSATAAGQAAASAGTAAASAQATATAAASAAAAAQTTASAAYVKPGDGIPHADLRYGIRDQLDLAGTALQPGAQLTQSAVTAATAVGVALLGAADAAAQRTALGLGTAATTAATAYATAAQGAKADNALPANAGALANLLEASATTAPADLARIRASVSGDAVISEAMARLGYSRKIVIDDMQPRLLAPNGAFSNTSGAFTLGTALLAVPNGLTPGGGNCWMYLPAGAGGLAGAAWYEVTFSTTTAGQIVGSPTTTATAWTQTTSQVAALTLSIPGGALGPNGILTLDALTVNNNTAGIKNVFYNLPGSTSGNLATVQNATVTSGRISQVIANRGGNSRQVIGSRIGYPGLGVAAAVPYFSINTAESWIISVGLQVVVPTDFVLLEFAAASVDYVV